LPIIHPFFDAGRSKEAQTIKAPTPFALLKQLAVVGAIGVGFRQQKLPDVIDRKFDLNLGMR
jgi:hypothetical protein